jgi:hypothetical protein
MIFKLLGATKEDDDDEKKPANNKRESRWKEKKSKKKMICLLWTCLSTPYAYSDATDHETKERLVTPRSDAGFCCLLFFYIWYLF